MAFCQVIHMVSVRNGFVSASRAMTVFFTVGVAGMLRRAGSGILGIHLEAMLIRVALVGPMHVAVVQVVGVAVVFDCGMAATGAMGMSMYLMNLMIGRHDDSPLMYCVLGMVRPHEPARSIPNLQHAGPLANSSCACRFGA